MIFYLQYISTNQHQPLKFIVFPWRRECWVLVLYLEETLLRMFFLGHPKANYIIWMKIRFVSSKYYFQHYKARTTFDSISDFLWQSIFWGVFNVIGFLAGDLLFHIHWHRTKGIANFHSLQRRAIYKWDCCCKSHGQILLSGCSTWCSSSGNESFQDFANCKPLCFLSPL